MGVVRHVESQPRQVGLRETRRQTSIYHVFIALIECVCGKVWFREEGRYSGVLDA